MGIGANLERLRHERKPRKISQTELAKASGVRQQLVSQIENDNNESTKELPALAKALTSLLGRPVTVDEIDPDYATEAASSVIAVPLTGMTSASRLVSVPAVERLHLDEAHTIRLTGLDPRGDWIALKVEGTSMDRISPPESVIVVNLKDKKLVPNACYVIETDEGEITYKRYRPGPDRWEPVSTDPTHETLYPPPRGGPKVVGRVKKTILDL